MPRYIKLTAEQIIDALNYQQPEFKLAELFTGDEAIQLSDVLRDKGVRENLIEVLLANVDELSGKQVSRCLFLINNSAKQKDSYPDYMSMGDIASFNELIAIPMINESACIL